MTSMHAPAVHLRSDHAEVTPALPRLCGRRPVSTIPVERAKALQALELYERFGVPAKKIATEAGVSIQTVYNWLNRAETYPEAASLRAAWSPQGTDRP